MEFDGLDVDDEDGDIIDESEDDLCSESCEDLEGISYFEVSFSLDDLISLGSK